MTPEPLAQMGNSKVTLDVHTQYPFTITETHEPQDAHHTPDGRMRHRGAAEPVFEARPSRTRPFHTETCPHPLELPT